MASVQELIAAIEAQRKPNPFASGLESTLTGIGQQVNQFPRDRALTTLRLAQVRQLELEIETRRKKDKLREEERKSTLEKLDKLSGTGKFDEEIKVGPSGVTRTFTPKDLTASEFLGVNQVMAIQSGDPEIIQRAFPLGIPKKLVASVLKEGVRITKEKTKAKTRKENIEIAARTVVQDINRGIRVLEKSMKGLVTTAAGPLGAILKFIPATDAFELERFAESVKSNISIDRLQAMREASPTGGALGQIPVQQQKFLMQLLGSLEVSQQPENLLDNMKRIYNIYNDLIHGEGKGPARFDLSFDEQGFPVEGGAKWPGTSALVPDNSIPGGPIDLGGGISFEEIR